MTAPDAHLTLTTLGRASLTSSSAEGGDTTLLGPGKPLALITYLAFSPRRIASRDHLVDLLWADTEPERALHAMRQTVWQIRQLLGERSLMNCPGGLELAARLTSDRDAFLRAVESGDLLCAVSLYGGDFLPSFAAPGGAAFEHWADIERVRLRTAFLRSAESLVQRFLAEGHVREAQRLARRARDTGPHSEGAWRLLLETLEAGNDWTQAAIEADGLERFLQAEEREPEPASRAALRRARRAPHDPEAAAQNAFVSELVGREKEFSAVVAAWDEAKRGTARHIHILAPAGIGKTRLLQDVHARLRAAGARTVHARANPGERAIPYAFAAEIAAALAALPGSAGLSPGAAAALVALNPTLSAKYAATRETGQGDDILRQRSVALTELLAAVAEEAPVAILLDDLHWADAASRQMLAGLAGHLERHRALLVTTSRPITERFFEQAPTVLRLAPLDEPQVGALVTSIGTLPDEEWARELPARLTWASGGSPLLLLESLQLAVERGAMALTRSAWSCPDPAALAVALGSGSALHRRLEELDPTAHWLILCLAAAGTPLTLGTLALAADQPEEAISAALAQLEERGLVLRMGGAWETGHDEIAALAIETTAADSLLSARIAVGRALMAQAGREPGLMRQAAALFVEAGSEADVARLFRSWVETSRRREDDRPPRQLAAELLADHGGRVSVHRLVSTLPWWEQLGLWNPARRLWAAGAAAAMLVVAGFLLWHRTPAEPPRNQVLYAVSDSAGRQVARALELNLLGWRLGDRLPLGAPVKDHPWPATELATPPVPSPSGRLWLVKRISIGDDGGQDIYLGGQNGPITRLTYSPGDDSSPDWAPDESAMVYETAQWDRQSHPDLAIMDLGTKRIRQLTHGDASDQVPKWSPGGSTIGFVRTYFDGREREACWISPSDSVPTCLALQGVAGGAVIGWWNDRQLVVQADSNGLLALRLVDIATRSSTPLPAPEASFVSLSPCGDWLAFKGLIAGTPREGWWVAPMSNPAALRPIEAGGAVVTDIVWNACATERSYLDTLRLTRPALAVAPDGTRKLEARGVDQFGKEYRLPPLTWSSGDPAVATVDSSGLVYARKLGRAYIRASAGGWRRDSALITIDTAGYQRVLSETWDGGLMGRWELFGQPLPRVVPDSQLGAAFLNNGDSSYLSGGYTRRSWDASRGLGVELVASLRLTDIQWQFLKVALDASLDSTTLDDWDHRSGDLDQMRKRSSEFCNVTLPFGEGLIARARIGVSLASRQYRVFGPPSGLFSGTPHRLRLQLFEDGRCGLAVDGAPLWISTSTLVRERPFRLIIDGKSHRTRVLVGHLEVWQGVRRDVDWKAAERN